MKHELHLSLGSNLGNRIGYLQQALDAIYERIGDTLLVAPLYETPAWGFSGEPFLNTCVKVATTLTPAQVLRQLLTIEQLFGRKRNQSAQGYQSRTIDIDILLYDDEIILDTDLTVPHPKMLHRKFVLVPLTAIAGEKVHPISHKTIRELAATTNDTSDIHELKEHLTNPMERSPFLHYKYIAIEGNIGSGKTTLSTMIAEDFNAKLILEQFSDNPFLPKFYEEPDRYGLQLEMSFLLERYQQMSGQLTQTDLFKEFVVSDYDIFKSLIFSQINLDEDDFMLYRKFFYTLYSQIIKPDVYVFLYQNTDRLLENIKKRGRDYEQNISPNYLKKIHSGYLDFIQKNVNINSLIIDVTELDFVKYPSDYNLIIDQIRAHKSIIKK